MVIGTRTRPYANLMMGLLTLVGSAVVIWQHRNILDWWQLRGYSPPAQIAALADATTMTDSGRRLFYVNRPELKSKADFRSYCSENEESLVLGCYITPNDIYILEVLDERLKGIHEVTAAHELLHAAYDRLSSSEREAIDKQLTAVFAGLQNARIKNTVERYRAKDPSIVPDELHSILATEVRDLPPELENYYKRYFSDRAKIVSFSEGYERAFTELEEKVAAYDEQIKSIKRRIESNQQQLDNEAVALETERARMDALLAANRVQEYNAAVSGFNNRVRRYNSLASATKNLISQYNELVDARNALAVQEGELVKAIDSRVDTLSEE